MIKGSGKRRHLSRQIFLLFLVAFLPLAAVAESGAYRIEILVFRYSNSAATPQSIEKIAHYPFAWRLFEPRSRLIPEDPAPLGAMSDRMRSAWRSLERNADFEPLKFQTWEQSRIDYHPPVRIHDDEVLFQRLEVPGDQAWIDLTAEDPFAPYRQSWYRLDGTVQLRRTRFLHLDLDLEFRVEIVPPETEQATPAAPQTPFVESARPTRVLQPPPYWNAPDPLLVPMESFEPPVPGALTHHLNESRQVRTGDVLYFDTPFLGVLARVTATAGE